MLSYFNEDRHYSENIRKAGNAEFFIMDIIFGAPLLLLLLFMNGSSSNNQAQQTAASQNQQTQIPISTSLPIIHQGNISSPAVPEPSDLSLAIAGGGVVIRFNLRKRFGK